MTQYKVNPEAGTVMQYDLWHNMGHHGSTHAAGTGAVLAFPTKADDKPRTCQLAAQGVEGEGKGVCRGPPSSTSTWW